MPFLQKKRQNYYKLQVLTVKSKTLVDVKH